MSTNVKTAEAAANYTYDVEAVRADFPILGREVYGKPLVYLDNGASAQKPRAVIDTVTRTYEEAYSNVHRGAHFLSGLATDLYEEARVKVAKFMNAATDDEIVFTGNATEAINLVAHSYGKAFLSEGDEVVISEMEHHANIVPWQMLREDRGIVLKVVPIDETGQVRMDAFEALLGERTKLVAITHCSNVLGTVTPIDRIIELAHAAGIHVMVDGSQGIVHGKVDVRALDADFYVWTGHKLYGPSGVGVLYGKMALMEQLPPYMGGGEMIDRVSFEKTTYKEPPHRFEAGTPQIVQAIGLGAAIDYVNALGQDQIAAHENEILAYATEGLTAIEGLRIYGTAPGKAAIISFLVEGIHPYDMATVLDRDGVAVRVGQHCAEPLMDVLGVDGTLRASFALYNNKADADRLIEAVVKARKMLG